jgi:hypothetical protein
VSLISRVGVAVCGFDLHRSWCRVLDFVGNRNVWVDVVDEPLERFAFVPLLDLKSLSDVAKLSVFRIAHQSVVVSDVVVKPNLSDPIGVPSIATLVALRPLKFKFLSESIANN